jgi:hypothetical protein
MRSPQETAFPIGLRTPIPEPEGAALERAQRDREVQRLEREIAYHAARSDIECYCVREQLPPGRGAASLDWYDTTRVSPAPQHPDDLQFLTDAVRYLDLRRLLVRHPERSHLVRIRDWP